MHVRTLLLCFPDVRLPATEIGHFRGYFNQHLGWQDALFHNHTDQPHGVIYRYPRVQYRSFRGCAALFGIEEGYEALDALVRQHLDALPEAFWRFERREARGPLALTETDQTYHLRHWLGLNTIRNRDGLVTDLEQVWETLPTQAERLVLLERVLTAQVLKFCGELGYRVPNRGLRLRVESCRESGRHSLHSQTGQYVRRSFDLSYHCNLHLPDYVAFGKAVSKGFGWQVRADPAARYA